MRRCSVDAAEASALVQTTLASLCFPQSISSCTHAMQIFRKIEDNGELPQQSLDARVPARRSHVKPITLKPPRMSAFVSLDVDAGMLCTLKGRLSWPESAGNAAQAS